jgi:ribose-phosphate pyrophosphokinase
MIQKYPDGSSYAEIERFDKDFIFRINSYEDLWHLKQITDAYQYNGLMPTITIPNLIDAQADRRFASNQSNGLKLMCEFLNTMHANFKIFHPHNSEVVEALMNNVEIIDNSGFINHVLGIILFEQRKYNKEAGKLIGNPSYNYTFMNDSEVKIINDQLILMSSDAGGFKPLMKLCDKIGWQGETYSASKARLTGNSEPILFQKVDKEDFGGKDILIIDDICVYGGTFKGLSKLLKERNCGKLYLAISHMTILNLGKDPVTNYFDKVFTTNSKYDNYYTSKDLYLSSDKEGNEYMVTEKVTLNNLKIIKMFK